MVVPIATVTANSLAERMGIPVTTLHRRLRKLEIIPDVITVEKNRPSVLQFRTERLPELRRLLTQPEIVLL